MLIQCGGEDGQPNGLGLEKYHRESKLQNKIPKFLKKIHHTVRGTEWKIINHARSGGFMKCNNSNSALLVRDGEGVRFNRGRRQNTRRAALLALK